MMMRVVTLTSMVGVAVLFCGGGCVRKFVFVGLLRRGTPLTNTNLYMELRMVIDFL